MKKNILIVTSLSLNNFLLNILKQLYYRNFFIFLLKQYDIKLPKNLDIFSSDNFVFRFNKGRKDNFIFIFLLPILYIFAFLKMLKYKNKYQIRTVVCFGLHSKIIFTPLTKILNLKCVWIDDFFSKDQGKLVLFFYKLFSKKITIITFTSLSASNLKRFNIKNVVIIPPGFCRQEFKTQSDIFSRLAHLRHRSQKRFFTVGTITALNNKNKIEFLCHSIRKSLSMVPNLQLIVVGGGRFGPKNSPWTKWLTKKMEIDNLCWFVGEQDNVIKWMGSFDVFVFLEKFLKINHFDIIFSAITNRLPIIGLDKSGLEDIVNHNKSALLLEINSSDELSKYIIRLYKNPFLRKQLQENAYQSYKKHFTIENIVNKLEKFL